MPQYNKTVVAWDLQAARWYHQVNDPQHMLCAHTKIIYGKDISKWKTLIVVRPEIIFPKCHDSPGLTM